MGYRDEQTVLKERIEKLELQLTKMTGRAMLLGEERDALRDRLELLTRDPKALSRARSQSDKERALYLVVRLVGALSLGAALLPLITFELAMLASGELGVSLVCGLVPAFIVFGVLLLKLPEIARFVQVRQERKAEALRAAQLGSEPAGPRVRAPHVSADAWSPEEVPAQEPGPSRNRFVR